MAALTSIALLTVACSDRGAGVSAPADVGGDSSDGGDGHADAGAYPRAPGNDEGALGAGKA